jgi:hypothetical protein
MLIGSPGAYTAASSAIFNLPRLAALYEELPEVLDAYYHPLSDGSTICAARNGDRRVELVDG